jgi:hypothetical protein
MEVQSWELPGKEASKGSRPAVPISYLQATSAAAGRPEQAGPVRGPVRTSGKPASQSMAAPS